jgi:predicted transcriptional regulator
MEFSTVQTYLRRLEKKGYLRTKLDGRTRVYSPRVKPRTVIRETINDVVERLFGGDTMPLMEHLIEDRGISDDDIVRLKQLLKRLEKKG